MFPFYTLSSPYPAYPSFTRPHPTSYHGPHQPPSHHLEPHHELFHRFYSTHPSRQPSHHHEHEHNHDMDPQTSQSRTRTGSIKQQTSHHDHDDDMESNMSYVPRSRPMNRSFHPPRQVPHASYYNDPSYYQHDDDYDQYYETSHPYLSRLYPRMSTRGPRRGRAHPHSSHPKHREDGHGMGLPPFQEEYDESHMYPPSHNKQHIPPFQHEWDDQHDDQVDYDELESDNIPSQQQQQRQVPIRVIPVSFTNVPHNRGPLRRRFLITHEPSHMESDSDWDIEPSKESSYSPQDVQSLLQANPEALRPLLLQLLPLYEPYLRQALKHDHDKEEKDKGNKNKVKDNQQQDKENKPNINNKENKSINTNTKPNKADIKTNTNNASTIKPQSNTTTGSTKSTNNTTKSQINEPEIKKMTPPTTRMRIVHPVQEKTTHLDQSEAYTVPPPTQDEIQEQLPPPARPRQIYAYTAHHENKDKDKKKEENTTTNNNNGASQRNIDIRETSTSRDIPIRETRGTTTSTSTTTAPTTTPPTTAPTTTPTTTAPTTTPSPSTRNIPIREHPTSTTKPTESSHDIKQDQPVEPTKTMESSESTSTTTPITPTPHVRRHSPTVEIEDVPPTPHHTMASPVHRHTESSVASDVTNSATTTTTAATTTTTTPSSAPSSTTTPTTTIKEEEEKVEVKEEKSILPETTSDKTETEATTTTIEPTIKTTTTTIEHTTTTTTIESQQAITPQSKIESSIMDTPSGMSHISPVSIQSNNIPESSHDVNVGVDGHDSSPTQSPHSPASSTYSSILQSCTESPNISVPTSPDQHHRMNSDHDWTFTSPLLKTAFLKKHDKEVDMKLLKEEKQYIITITLPEHITKHDIRLDTDATGITVESMDDPPMFASRTLSLPIDADMNNLQAKSELIDDLHTIIVKIPKKITNKRPIRIE